MSQRQPNAKDIVYRPPHRDREPNPLLGQACDNAGTEPVYSVDAG